MKQNVLQDKDNSTIFLKYTDFEEHNYGVIYKFMDKEQCFVATPTPTEFTKPKSNTPAELVVYRPEGVYKSKVKIIDTHYAIRETVFLLSLPKKWDFSQARSSSRKQIKLHFNLDFGENFVIDSNLFDISMQAFSFIREEEIPSIYKQVSGKLTIDLPSGYNKKQIVVDAKFKRLFKQEIGYDNQDCYVYRFLNLSEEDSEILKMLLISAN